MFKLKNIFIIYLLNIILSSIGYGQSNFSLNENFEKVNTTYEKIGRGTTIVKDGVLSTKDAYMCFGEKDWANYEITFDARVPENEEQVQICAGFRAANRDDRYILMLKGEIQKFLYLARLGYMGADDYLTIKQLDFKPETGKWYNFKIQTAGQRIRVFLNNEADPRIDFTDAGSKFAPAGKVTLGGSWITNEFRALKITSLDTNIIAKLPTKEYAPLLVNKEAKRIAERSAYRPLLIDKLNTNRTEISLNGKWLFAPDYEIADDSKAIAPTESDQKWHVMTVPNFWNPTRVWLYGERYNGGSKGVADNYFQKETDRCEAYTFDYEKIKTAWYRHWVMLPKSAVGKRLQLSFDAASKVAEVYVNGKLAGKHIGMFRSSVVFSLTTLVKFSILQISGMDAEVNWLLTKIV